MTLESVINQENKDFEFIIVDGGSTDGSVEAIQQYWNVLGDGRGKWISEPDKGIYNAMNKGILMASGEYVQFLNSGDCLAAANVTDKMLSQLKKEGYPSILYGNILKKMPKGRVLRDRCFAGQDITFLGFYTGTLTHSTAYIKRSLFDKYGMYDETLMIVSDWKWYLSAIVFGGEKPAYVDIDVTLFDMNGISETNKGLDKVERKQVLSTLIPAPILTDYNQWAFPIEQMKRLKRHPWSYKIVWFLERCLFKLERWSNKCKNDCTFR